ncbi:PREDICTED: putative F-box protein At5g41500 [Camelina sativa]|uniref:F-box protein At5g41500 n=1 Tax=Camelina sativa TaxID=90675 RepID=A0ABM1QC11_CAMSA|nr:PREDICTED: putative F-box protein At5g41500 [Camelina sativa]
MTKSRSRTMISNLPRDLIEEIISRAPWNSMKAVRLTCKSWNNIAKSESFTKMHIGKVTREGEATMIMKEEPHGLYLMSGFVDFDPSIKVIGQLRFRNNQVTIYRILHFEGLLLCILQEVSRIVVWNPYLVQTRWIMIRYSHRPHRCDYFNYALGYQDKKYCRSIKFLRFIDYYGNRPYDFFWYEIYDFDYGIWKTLDVTPHWSIYWSSDCVSIKGNSYWCANKRSSKSHINHIICFDFTRERFGPLLPMPSTIKDGRYVALSCVKEEKLAASLRQHESSEFDIWITTKIEVEMVSWCKFLRIDTRPKVDYPHCFFIDEEKKIYMYFSQNYEDSYRCKTYMNIIGEAGYLKKLDVQRYTYDASYAVCSYVPSLIQIKKHARGKRIKQSSLEKRRVDQNKLRLASIEMLV